MLSCDVAIIGGGSAGLSAALSAKKQGAQSLMLFERENSLGGILNQCIHNGFGLHRFGEELTGPEYAHRDIQEVLSLEGLEVFTQTSVLNLDTEKMQLKVVGPKLGLEEVQAKAIVLACGCRERTRGAINLAGSRPSGVFTAGCAQRLVNINGALVGKRVVILGSGDIGLIMARRMLYEGAEVLCVCELMSQPSGLRRNIVQCLDDYGIELKLSTTVVEVHGTDRLEAVSIAQVDPESLQPNLDSIERIECDALLLSVGLIPENGLAQNAGILIDPKTQGPWVNQHLMTSAEGVFCCGNELHVHDLVDFVSEEGKLAGASAAWWAAYGREGHLAHADAETQLICGFGIGSATPQIIKHPKGQAEDLIIRFRPNLSAKNASVVLKSAGEVIKKQKKLIVVPSEMMDIKLSSQEQAQLGDTLEISLELDE